MDVSLTIEKLIESLQKFAPDTPCVGHFWIAGDLGDVAPELTPEEVVATLALADKTLDAENSLSWYFLRHCLDTMLARRLLK